MAKTEKPDPDSGKVERGLILRSIRRQQGLSLQDVEEETNQEFKGSVLGAYERGERNLSVQRLKDLCSFYGVSAATVVEPIDVSDEVQQYGFYYDSITGILHVAGDMSIRTHSDINAALAGLFDQDDDVDEVDIDLDEDTTSRDRYDATDLLPVSSSN